MAENKNHIGRLTTNNVVLEIHEYSTINILLSGGNDVELVEKSRTPHSKSADILMLGMFWEMKSPNGQTMRCVEHALRRATHQAQNIIMDLRRIKIDDSALINLLERNFYELRSVRNLWIITKRDMIIKYKK